MMKNNTRLAFLLPNYKINKKYFITLIFATILAFPSHATDGDIGLSTAFVTIVPFYTTFSFSEDTLNKTKSKTEENRKKANKAEEYKKRVLKAAEDDAMTFIATDGREGKTVKFEAAAREIRKTNKTATDYEIAKTILRIP
ncbi:DUF2388 domain-containing protein [Entomomonas moraniae]|nr:DUF2388 domain-containing protein [Entomomonas moraniae]